MSVSIKKSYLLYNVLIFTTAKLSRAEPEGSFVSFNDVV